jgi:ABC-type dipeptide/oligopeptide/nickel transport system permease subunit
MQQTNTKFLQKLLQKKLAVVGVFIILFTLLVALFGYWLAPDNVQFANTQCVEIQAKPIGYKQLFFKQPLLNNQSPKNAFGVLLNGQNVLYKFLPIKSYTINANTFTIQRFIDEDTAVAETYPITTFAKTADALKSLFTQKTFYLGTDKFGRDVLSRLIIGTKVSMAVGCTALIIALFVGILLGLLAGYFGGLTDAIIMWCINIIWSIPTLLLVFACTLILGKGFLQIFIAIGLTMWVPIARLVRGQTLAEKQLDYITAARVLGFGPMRIMFKHILPNIMGPILVLGASTFASAIIIEAGLSFLGIGIQAPQPSWGLMIKENYNFIVTNKPFIALIPGISIMLLVLAFNIFGNALRDVLDVKN